MMDFKTRAQNLQRVLGEMIQGCDGSIEGAARVLQDVILEGGTIFTCGNGGSAATAAHMVEEMVGKFVQVRRPIPAVCLNADATAMSCIANDFGWPDVFSRQIAAVGSRGDALVAFSTSGESSNVIRAIQHALNRGMAVIHVGGRSGGTGGRMADISVRVPSPVVARIQEVHTLILHYFLERLEEVLDTIPESESS
jgi:D-sedoheptulose 7-phosphate isomerase